MKRLFTLLIAVVLTVSVFAQAPQKMSYQAVIRDNLDHLVTSHSVGIQITILQGSPTGTVVYTETQTPSTNANGLISIEIGGGAGFSSIDWSNSTYFLKTEVDPAGGTSYSITGTSQLLSVPYALYASSSGTTGSLLWHDGDEKVTTNVKVGIGTANPEVDLEIRSAQPNYWSMMTIGNSDLSHAINIFPGREGDPNPFISWKHGDPLRFSTDHDGWSEKMRITSNGNMGIGISDPAEKLEVNGNIDVHNNTIKNLADPVNEQDAATKAYIDAILSQLSAKGAIVADAYGNIYSTVRIGSQVWMGENLKTTKYNDGTSVPLVEDNSAWSNLTTPGYCWYNNNAANKDTYGALYNWHTVNTGKLCPTGWHVPTDAEWNTMENYLIANGYNYDGTTTGNKYAKSLASTSGWTVSSTTGAVGNTDYPGKRNATGFTALPGGYRYYGGTFTFLAIGGHGYWWSATENDATVAWYRYLNYDLVDVRRDSNFKKSGFSVRCVRD